MGPKPPVYFLGIGGPNFISNTAHPAYAQLRATGREITARVRPEAVVVVSAHWQHARSAVAVNVADEGALIYDFYGFPQHFYKVEFPHRGSRAVAERVQRSLESAGVAVEKVKRGLDHGVWVGFLAAFDPKENPLDVPIVQLSLLDSDDPAQHYRLGAALAPLRDEGILIVGAGMAVHNLHDFRRARDRTEPFPYSMSFEEAIAEAVARPQGRQEALAALLQRPDARLAHPSLEHVLPLYVAAGAAGGDAGRRIWGMAQGSLNWAQYRFGDADDTA